MDIFVKSEKKPSFSYKEETCILKSNKKFQHIKEKQTKKQNTTNTAKNTSKPSPFYYICEKCDFKSNNKTHYKNHLQTKKHNTSKNTSKPSSFCYICENCKFKTNNKSHYNHHIHTEKHKRKHDMIECKKLHTNVNEKIVYLLNILISRTYISISWIIIFCKTHT